MQYVQCFFAYVCLFLQADELRLLWEHHGGAGLSRTELQDVLLRIGSEMEGGWTSRQIRTLLKKEGLIRTSTRGKKGMSAHVCVCVHV